jgi:hypothetical protein
MAKFVYTDVVVTIGTTDLSDHIASVELSESRDDIETTAFGVNARTRISGLADNSLTIDFHEDFSSQEVHQTIYPLIGGTVGFSISPAGTVISDSNPLLSGTVLVTEWTTGGAIGDLAGVSVTWPISGPVTKSTAV